MENNISHHEINKATKFKVDQKKHEAKKRKFEPKTKVQRLKTVFYILTATWMFCQFGSALMASTGFIHLALTKLDSPFLSIPLVLFLSVGLEVIFNGINKTIAKQKYDDENTVSPILFVLLAVFGAFYAISSFIGTPYAVEFLAAKPNYHNIELIKLGHDRLIKADTTTKNQDIFMASSVVASHFIAYRKKDCKTCPYRLRSVAVKPHSKKEARRDSLIRAKEIVLAVLLSDKKDAVKLAKEENKVMESEFSAWCSSFGFGLSLLTLVLILVFLPSYAWCAKYERDEVEDNETILTLQNGTKAKVVVKETKVEDKGEGQRTPKVTDKQESTPIGFAVASTKEGDIEKGEGRKRDRVWCMVSGNLVLKTMGQMNTLIKGQSTRQRIDHLTILRDKLKTND